MENLLSCKDMIRDEIQPFKVTLRSWLAWAELAGHCSQHVH